MFALDGVSHSHWRAQSWHRGRRRDSSRDGHSGAPVERFAQAARDDDEGPASEVNQPRSPTEARLFCARMCVSVSRVKKRGDETESRFRRRGRGARVRERSAPAASNAESLLLDAVQTDREAVARQRRSERTKACEESEALVRGGKVSAKQLPLLVTEEVKAIDLVTDDDRQEQLRLREAQKSAERVRTSQRSSCNRRAA